MKFNLYKLYLRTEELISKYTPADQYDIKYKLEISFSQTTHEKHSIEIGRNYIFMVVLTSNLSLSVLFHN